LLSANADGENAADSKLKTKESVLHDYIEEDDT
jgi:hypothetical protein